MKGDKFFMDKSEYPSRPETTDRDPLDAPVGWIRPETYQAMCDKAMAYRRQLIASGIKPDLETYRSE